MQFDRATFWRVGFVASALCLALIYGVLHAHAEPMRASWYGVESGVCTASGARFEPMGLTAAHRTLPFGTELRVCRARCVTITINDRGPAKWTGRSLDLSRGAARAIGLESAGTGLVETTITRERPYVVLHQCHQKGSKVRFHRMHQGYRAAGAGHPRRRPRHHRRR